MINPKNVPPVNPDERLARFILFSRHIRQDNTLKPDAFIPNPYTTLSVTRYRDSTDEEVNVIGNDIANKRGRTFYGRGDLQASSYLKQELATEAEPVSFNSNHVNISNWPVGRPAQMIIAKKLVTQASFVPNPVNS